eukprot:6108703-Alexandrium_andersonii.AAC.1
MGKDAAEARNNNNNFLPGKAASWRKLAQARKDWGLVSGWALAWQGVELTSIGPALATIRA